MKGEAKNYYRDLTPLIKPCALARPLNWAEIFGRQAPLELEIGFGNGEYINRLSLEYPETDFVGVELAWESTKRALRRLARPPRPNVRLMLLKAEVALDYCFAPESLSVIRALFPVPWPDERQARKRLFQRSFLDLAASRLKPDGRFLMVTDSPELADWTEAEAQDSALKLELTRRPPELDTKYERKWQIGGQRDFFRLEGGRRGGPIIYPQAAEAQMQAQYRDQFNPESFAPEGCTEDGLVVRFREFIFDAARGEGLLRAFTVEGSLTQDFYIRVKKDGQRWKFSAAIASELFPTRAVARAVQLAAAWEA